MDGATQNERLIRFSVFEVDRESGELFKQGRKVKLQGQPFELLVALLERPGTVVTREELRRRIWPSDTAGDFDHGLNRAVNRVREALGDAAEAPRFIETLPRRGYRFIGSIQEKLQAPPRLPDLAPSAPELEKVTPPRRTLFFALAIAAAALIATLSLWIGRRAAERRASIQLRQLTTNSLENPVWAAIVSPDGKYVAYGDSAGIKIQLVSTGETHLLPKPAALSADEPFLPAAWFPDGTRILASAQGRVMTCWSVSVIGASMMKIRDNAQVHSVSPDGSLIAFTTGKDLVQRHNGPLLLNSEIWVMGAQGENPQKLISGDDRTYFGAVEWSPDGKRIAYRKLHLTNEPRSEYSIETRSLDGRSSSVVLYSREHYYYSEVFYVGFADDFAWMPDGRLIYAKSESPPNTRDRNLWAITVDPKTGQARGSPHRITNLTGFSMEGISATADGKRLVFGSRTEQFQVYTARVSPGWKLDTPRRLTFDERYNSVCSWTADSKSVVFISDRSGKFAIYKQRLDQNEAELIRTGPENVGWARVSPDGDWLVYTIVSTANVPRVMRIPVSGGAPELLFEVKSDAYDFDCPHRGSQCIIAEASSDSKRFVFESFDPLNGVRHRIFEIVKPEAAELHSVVSHDGSRIAIVGADPQGRIEIRSL